MRQVRLSDDGVIVFLFASVYINSIVYKKQMILQVSGKSILQAPS